jgi:hypothetical protein
MEGVSKSILLTNRDKSCWIAGSDGFDTVSQAIHPDTKGDTLGSGVEYWSIGVLEYWGFNYSINPSNLYSSLLMLARGATPDDVRRPLRVLRLGSARTA